MDYIKEISFGLSLLSLIAAVMYFARPETSKVVRRRVQDPALGDYKSINARD